MRVKYIQFEEPDRCYVPRAFIKPLIKRAIKKCQRHGTGRGLRKALELT